MFPESHKLFPEGKKVLSEGMFHAGAYERKVWVDMGIFLRCFRSFWKRCILIRI